MFRLLQMDLGRSAFAAALEAEAKAHAQEQLRRDLILRGNWKQALRLADVRWTDQGWRPVFWRASPIPTVRRAKAGAA